MPVPSQEPGWGLFYVQDGGGGVNGSVRGRRGARKSCGEEAGQP